MLGQVAFILLLLIPVLSNAATSNTDETTDFIVNRAAFWLSLAVSLATALGIGIKVATYLRKKVSEDRLKFEERLNHKLDNLIPGEDIKNRFGRYDLMFNQVNSRLENLERQNSMQFQVIMQNQENIKEFLSEQRTKRGPGRPKKEDVAESSSSS